MNIQGYRIELQPLDPSLGSGFIAFAPELKGCLADGESRTMALLNLEDAIACWIGAARRAGRPVPAPGVAQQDPWGKFP